MRLAPAILAILCAGSAVTLAAAPASAQHIGVQVEYRDLNLGAPEGRATLDRRLRQAAQQACGRSAALNRVEVASVAQCERAALTSARARAERLR